MNRDLFPSPAPCCGENISSELCGVREPCHWIVSIPPSLLFPLYTSPSEAEDQFIFQCALPGSLSKLLLALCVLSSDLGSCFHLGCVWSVNGLEVAGGFETPTGRCWGGVMQWASWKLVHVLLGTGCKTSALDSGQDFGNVFGLLLKVELCASI